MKQLPTIEPIEHLAHARSGVLSDAKAIRDGLSRRLSSLTPAAVLALAMSEHPGDSAAAALLKLKANAASFFDALEAKGEQVKAAVDAERQRLSVVVAAAAHRELEIVGIVERIGNHIRAGERTNLEKRNALQKAGLSGAELDAAAIPTGFDHLHSERAALIAEGEALARFLQTRDPRHIPEGFADEVDAVA